MGTLEVSRVQWQRVDQTLDTIRARSYIHVQVPQILGVMNFRRTRASLGRMKRCRPRSSYLVAADVRIFFCTYEFESAEDERGWKSDRGLGDVLGNDNENPKRY